MQKRAFSLFARKAPKNELPEWPQVHRIKLREIFMATFWGVVFFTPFVYAQYSYKTRTGLSSVNFSNRYLHLGYSDSNLSESNQEGDTDGGKKQQALRRRAEDYLTSVMNTDEKPGSRY